MGQSEIESSVIGKIVMNQFTVTKIQNKGSLMVS